MLEAHFLKNAGARSRKPTAKSIADPKPLRKDVRAVAEEFGLAPSDVRKDKGGLRDVAQVRGLPVFARSTEPPTTETMLPLPWSLDAFGGTEDQWHKARAALKSLNKERLQSGSPVFRYPRSDDPQLIVQTKAAGQNMTSEEKKGSLADVIVSQLIEGAQRNKSATVQVGMQTSEQKLAAAKLGPVDIAKISGALYALGDSEFTFKEASELIGVSEELLRAVVDTVK